MNDPAAYEKHKSYVKTDVDTSMASIFKHMEFQSEELFLDFGCGAGSTGYKHLVPLAEKLNSKIHAVDISPEMICYARENYPHPRITYWQKNILDDENEGDQENIYNNQSLTKLKVLESLRFHRIISINVIQSINEYKKALRRLYSFLQPGGQFGFASIVRGQSLKLLQSAGQHPKFSEYMKGYEQWIPAHLLTGNFESDEVLKQAKEDYKEGLIKAGFIIKHLDVEIRRFSHTNIETSIDLFLSINPYVREIPIELYEELRQVYRQKLWEIYGLDEISEQSFEQRHDVLIGVVEKPKNMNL